ncbi:MAG: outer membrane protein transport protein [Desulfobulbaceae bacterium]|nr:outer membrane protein transport protein [Desulfobulbaceae bacterium]
MKLRIILLKNVGVLFCGMIFLFQGTTYAQEIEFASSPNPVGSGARALGMGGAFIAVADDATAASWNPGGLIQLERPEVSIVGAWFHRSEDNTFGDQPEGNGTQSISEGNLNYLSAAYPFIFMDRNMIVALTYQHLYDFNRSWQLNLFHRDGDLFFDRMVDYNQDGGLSALGLSYAVQIIPALSAGITVNIWDDDIGYNHWTQNTFYTAPGNLGPFRIQDTYRNIDSYSFEGYNFNLGFLWRITESITVGGVFKSPFTADVQHDASLAQKIVLLDDPSYPPLWEIEQEGAFNEELDMPASYGIGVSYRFSDALTASLDLYRTEWGDMIYTDHEGVKTSAISGIEESESDIDATVQVRAGMEYLIIKPKYIIPLRAGIFYDPAPSEGSSDNFYGFTLGTGFGWKRYIFDVGYQFRYGGDVGSAIYKSGKLSQDVSEHTLYASLIVHF